MKTIQQDLRSNILSLNEAIYVAQNSPLWETGAELQKNLKIYRKTILSLIISLS